MVVIEQPAQLLAARDLALGPTDFVAGPDDPVIGPLVVSGGVMVFEVEPNRPQKRAFAEQDHPAQVLGRQRKKPAFDPDDAIRRPGGQEHWLGP